MCGSVVFERRSLAAAPAGISLESNGEPSSASFSLPAPLLPLRLPLALGSPCQHYLLPQLVAFAFDNARNSPDSCCLYIFNCTNLFPLLPTPSAATFRLCCRILFAFHSFIALLCLFATSAQFITNSKMLHLVSSLRNIRELFGSYFFFVCCCFVFRVFPLEIKLRTVLYFVYTHFIFCFII